MWVGIVPSIEGLNRRKGQRKAEFTLPVGSWVGTLVYCTWTGTYTTGFPEPSACRWQIIGLLNFHNHSSWSMHLSLHHSLLPPPLTVFTVLHVAWAQLVGPHLRSPVQICEVKAENWADGAQAGVTRAAMVGWASVSVASSGFLTVWWSQGSQTSYMVTGFFLVEHSKGQELEAATLLKSMPAKGHSITYSVGQNSHRPT